MLKITGKYTHKVDREYNDIMLEGAEIGTDSTGKPMTRIIPKQMNVANDYLVKTMTGESQEIIDDLSPEEYRKTLEEIQKIRDKKEEEKKN